MSGLDIRFFGGIRNIIFEVFDIDRENGSVFQYVAGFSGNHFFLARLVGILWPSRRIEQGKYASFYLFCCEWFANISLCACGDSSKNEGFASFGRNHYDGDAGGEVFISAGLEKLKSVHDGHIDVAHDQSEGGGDSFVGAKGLKSLLAVGSLQYFEQFQASLSQCSLDNFPHYCRIVND